MNHQVAEVGPGPVQRVLLCDLYGPRPEGYRGEATSLPGHLIQLMKTGRTVHEVGGRRYTLEPGSLVWFHEDEWVRIQVERGPWSFYTLNFIAPALPPPSFDRRVRRVGRPVQQAFMRLLNEWRNQKVDDRVRGFRVHAELNRLLGLLTDGSVEPYSVDPTAALWWELETWFRQDVSRPVSMADLVSRSGRSPATIARACRAALGEPPMARLKRVRMSLARGLVVYSTLQIGEVARRVGYARVHEFSRDYRKWFGEPPSATRSR